MEEVLKNHIAVIRAQASILHRELKKSLNTTVCSAANELPKSLQKRCPAAESINSVRIIDNFEMTILYILDEDGKINEKNRLGKQCDFTIRLLV